ncbi:MAG: helix-turn-helix transcriptional regulator [Clostridia bacterium]|nr:helix-turn-helix transcriptional regulator [Clostridia bacterium]
MKRICESQIQFYGVHGYHYSPVKQHAPRIQDLKSQYVYRMMVITKGRLAVTLGEEWLTVRAGDLLYLLPGEAYRLEPEEEFALISIFFDFGPQKCETPGRKVDGCVFWSRFDPSLISPRELFADAPFLNQSGAVSLPEGQEIAKEIHSAHRGSPYFTLLAEAKLRELLFRLLQRVGHGEGEDRVAPILNYLRNHPTEDLSPRALEQRFGYHRNHINRLIRARAGCSLSEYVRGCKIDCAKALLSEMQLPPTQVALELGYYDYSHFYKAFLAHTGETPTVFCQRCRETGTADFTKKEK